MTIFLIVVAILYGLSCLLMGGLLLLPFGMMSGDPIPSKNWVWFFFIPAMLTWPIFPLVWAPIINLIDDYLNARWARKNKSA